MVVVSSSLLELCISFSDGSFKPTKVSVIVLVSRAYTMTTSNSRLSRGNASIVSASPTSTVIRGIVTTQTALKSVYLLLQSIDIDVLRFSLHIGTLDHLFQDFDLSILVFYFSFKIFHSGLGQLAKFNLGLQKFLAILICKLGLSSHLSFKIFNLGVFVCTLLFELIQSLVFALEVLGLFFYQYLQIILVIENLLKILLY